MAPRAPAGIQALCLFLHRVHTEAGPCLNSTQRCPQSGRTLHPTAGAALGTRGLAWEHPVCRRGGQQRCWGSLSPPPLPEHRWGGTWPRHGHRQGAGTRVALPWTQAGSGNPGGPALDTGGEREPRWPRCGHRRGVRTQVALPWTQAGSGTPGGPTVDTGGEREPRWPCLGHRQGAGTQVAPPWTQARGWVHAALLWRAHRLPCLGHRPGVRGWLMDSTALALRTQTH